MDLHYTNNEVNICTLTFNNSVFGKVVCLFKRLF